jgi:invasion protein IalB
MDGIGIAMTKPVLIGAFGGILAGILFASGAAFAQQAPDGGNAPPEVKAVQDWFVRCFPVESPNPCDMFQELDSQTTKQRVLLLSMAYVPSMDRHLLQILVPLDISIPKGVTIKTDSYTSPVLKYRRCDRNGCYVEMPADSALIEGLTKSGPAGKVNIVADNGKSYGLNFSLKGFAEAHDEMVAKARAKAKPVEKPGDPTAPARP